SSTELQWVVDAYTITFAGFLLLGGRVADRYGHRQMFVAALILFGLASLEGSLAQARGMLIGARAGQGFAGALMAASSLAIITSSFPPGPKLHRAIGTWAAMNGLGGAAGGLLGGGLTQALTRSWLLLVNLPLLVPGSPAVLGPIILGAPLLVAFVVIETRVASAPLVPFKELTKPLRTANNIVLLF